MTAVINTVTTADTNCNLEDVNVMFLSNIKILLKISKRRPV